MQLHIEGIEPPQPKESKRPQERTAAGETKKSVISAEILSSGLNAYSIFSRAGGESQGASLVFAFTAKQAKAMYSGFELYQDIDGYTDIGVRLVRDETLIAYANEATPHILLWPHGCENCNVWGCVDSDGICGNCSEPAGFEQWLIDRIDATYKHIAKSLRF